ncbi:MAG TPA: hypothetical protein VJL31_17930, partial [Gemmatimonadales bacterium]|nr:hypothetical protein [Gemmatimonadales bacterium]
MNSQLNTLALGVAGVLAGGLLVAVCFALYAVAGGPDPVMPLLLGVGPSFLGGVLGVVQGLVAGGLTGLVVGMTYNR